MLAWALGVLAMAMFGLTLPMTQIAIGSAEAPRLSPWFVTFGRGVVAAALSAVICTALWQSSTSGITVGGFASFVTAMLMLIAPIKHLSESASPITRGLAAVERGLDLIDQTPAEAEGQHDGGRARGDLVLQGVVVRYPGASHDALDQVTLRVEPGQTLALVGSSGSGKTTLINLLPRFVEPVAGSITLDGRELRSAGN